MKRSWNVVRVALIALALVGFVFASVSVAKENTQTTCPVMGAKLTSKDHYVDYQGKRIYFCCPGCDGMFKENPEKYLKEMEERGETPEPAPEKN